MDHLQKKVALYVRVSTDKQSNGLEAQLRSLKSYCETQGFGDCEIFRDEAISGAKSSRPALDELMTAIRNEKFSSVIVYSFSRFARSTRHLLEALEEFRSRNVDLAGPNRSRICVRIRAKKGPPDVEKEVFSRGDHPAFANG